ncbi:ricin B lectin domain-containing protein [Dichotomocladium elegans]|nr:ricin B lectin domain-containing protein [Dichotomocladium elegans]
MSGFPVDTYFIIKSQKNGLLLSVSGSSTEASEAIVIESQKEAQEELDSQLWQFDDGFLTNKKSGLVIDISGGDLKAEQPLIQFNRKVTTTLNQRFGLRDGFIYTRADPRLVFDIKADSDGEGSPVIIYKRKFDIDNANQQWSVEPFEG